MENGEFEYVDDFEDYEDEEEKEEGEPKLLALPPLPLIPSLAYTRELDVDTENDEISSFLNTMLDEATSEVNDDSRKEKDEDTTSAEPLVDPTEKESGRPNEGGNTKKESHRVRTRGQPLAVTKIIDEGIGGPETTNWDDVINLRIEILTREHRRSQLRNLSSVCVVREKPQSGDKTLGAINFDRPDTEIVMIENVESVTESNLDDITEVPEVVDGEATETEPPTDPATECIDNCTPLQVFYQPYPADIALPVPVPEVKIKMVRLSRTPMDILLRRTTPYVPPSEKKGPKIWNTFQKIKKTAVSEIDEQEKIEVETPKKKSLLRRLITFFRKKSSKVEPINR